MGIIVGIVALVIGVCNVVVACVCMHRLPEARHYWYVRTTDPLNDAILV